MGDVLQTFDSDDWLLDSVCRQVNLRALFNEDKFFLVMSFSYLY